MFFSADLENYAFLMHIGCQLNIPIHQDEPWFKNTLISSTYALRQVDKYYRKFCHLS